MTQSTLLVGILAFVAWVAMSQWRESRARGSGISKEDRHFLRQAVAVGASEVTLSELALQTSTAVPVQHLAKRIVDDHSQVNRKLASLAWRYKVNVSAQPSAETQARARQLNTLRGYAFDCAYDDVIVEDELKAIELFTAASRSDNPDIRRLAEATLPTLDLHLKLAENLETGMTHAALPPM
ncbi:DUF4142 domain-containing protein [Dyella jejuensis]|uniref:DUF4142 domain-containing protein n=1 Tax=Dyella jejuensis TaxID=1432009 RepID=A0ABW8JLF3_9GAMM